MSEAFDPYRKWLGIPVGEQPPNHYRLLGIGLYESDHDVIESAADRQMKHVQSKRSGKHVELTQKLLNELTTAKLCLLNSQKKEAYDSLLIEQSASTKRPAPPAQSVSAPHAISLPPTQQPSPGTSPSAQTVSASEESVFVRKSARSITRRGRKPNKNLFVYAVSAIAAISLMGVIIILAFVFGASESDKPSTPVAVNNKQLQPSHPPITNLDNRSDEPSDLAPKVDPPLNPFAEIPDKGDKPEPEPANLPPTDPSATESLNDGELPPKDLGPENVEPPPKGSYQQTPKWKRGPFEGRIELGDVASSLSIHPLFTPAKLIALTDEKKPVPSAEELENAMSLVREVYDDEIVAAQSVEDQIAFASVMSSKAAEEEETSATRYALLQLAGDFATNAGEIATYFHIVDVMGREFEIDANRVKADVVFAESRKLNPAASAVSIASGALALVEQAVITHEYDLAEQLSVAGTVAASRSRKASLIKIAKAIESELPALREQFEAYQKAIKDLEIDPENSSAKLTVGKFTCFVLANWAVGLPYAAAGSEEAIANTAKMDIANPEDAAMQSQLGDEWFEMIEPANVIWQPAISERALVWYQRAAEKLTGLAKERVAARISALVEPTEPRTEPNSELVKNLIGKYFLSVTDKTTKQTKFSVLDFRDDFEVAENDEVAGRWEVYEGNRIKVTMQNAAGEVVYFTPKNSRLGVITTRSTSGDTWKMMPLDIVSTWEQKTEELMVFGRRIPGDLETLVFYSNGRLNDPLGNVRWIINGNNLSIDWGKSKKTIAVVSGDGKAYKGKTTSATGIGNTTLNRLVSGRLIEVAD